MPDRPTHEETHEEIVFRLASQLRASMEASGDEGTGLVSYTIPGDAPGRVLAIVHEGETKEEAAARAHAAAVDLWEASGRRFSRRWTLIEVGPGEWSVVAEGGTHFELTGSGSGPERVGLAEWAGQEGAG